MSFSKTSTSSTDSEFANSSIYDSDILTTSSCLSSDSSNHLPLPKKNPEKTKEIKKLCIICSSPSILISCQYPNCNSFLHLSCISLYFPELEKKKTCPSHSYKDFNLYQRRLHLALHSDSSPALRDLLKDQTSSQSYTDLTGKLFWYSINQQYFPYFTGKKPEFRQEFKSSLKPNSSWLGRKMQKAESKLLSVKNSISSLLDFDKILQNFSVNSSKKSENFLKTGQLQKVLQDALKKNSENLALFNINNSKKISSLSGQETVCSICDDGESADNLIVICSKCKIAVHCWCYNIQKNPETDWLCDPCSHSLSPNCVLCPVKGGSLKKAKENWVHVTCAKYLLNTESFDWNLKQINRDKFRAMCFACGKKTGACVKCSFRSCLTSFHVECRKDLIDFEGPEISWLCPLHKREKLSHLVRAEQESGFQFIDQVAENFWNKKFKKPGKKIIFKVLKDRVNVKFCVGNKVVKEGVYLEEGAERKRLIKATDSSKGELWVKLIVPREVYESCSKRQKL